MYFKYTLITFSENVFDQKSESNQVM